MPEIDNNQLAPNGAMQPPKRKKLRGMTLAAWAILLIGIGFTCTPAANWWTLRRADPAMISLANSAGMNRSGELYLLRTHPQVLSGDAFTSQCPSQDNQYVEEGCYLSGQSRIFIRSMPSELSTEETVIAAHEMLHAAYHGLSDSERSHVDSMLEAAYQQVKTPDLDKRMADYASSEPGARDSELHSILGSEFGNLPSDLEQYYDRYFQNRQDVVEAHNDVEIVFNNYEDSLNSLDARIKNEEATADSLYAKSVYYAKMGDAYYDDYYYNQYSKQIDTVNSDVVAYNSKLNSYNLLIAAYNGKDFGSLSGSSTQSHN